MIKTLKTYYFSSSIKALFYSALALLTLSCSKTTDKIGDGLLLDSDFIGVYYTDTLQVVCHSELADSLNTKGLSSVLLGSIMDPVIGRTNASIYTQLHLSSTNQIFGEQAVVDSIVLQLGLTGYYGDTTTLQTVHVYKLADSLSLTQSYCQYSEVATDNIDLANGYQFRPHPKTNYDTLQPVIRIPLTNSFGNELATLNTDAYASPDAFKKECYGLMITCESVTQDGAICYITPTSNEITRLIIYYRESPSDSPMNQKKYYFYITSEDAYFNRYEHDYSVGSANFVQQVINGDSTMGQDQLYLQSMGGVKAVLRFPNLAHWTDMLEPNTYLIINEAKLIFPASANLTDSSTYAPPASLALLNINDDGSTSLLQDYYEGTSYYGGSYSSANKSVTFRIGEHLQRIIMNKQDSQGLFVSIAGASYNAQRWIIGGPNADNGLRCQIKYSIVRK